MNGFLFDEMMLWVWMAWSLLTIVNGYLIADGFDSAEETVGFFATIALIGGGLSLFSQESFVQGAASWIKSTIMGFVIIPALPCFYLLPVGWGVGEAFGLEFFGLLGVTAFVVVSLGVSLLFLWVVALRVLKRTIHPFWASCMAVFVFAIAPAAALAFYGS